MKTQDQQLRFPDKAEWRAWLSTNHALEAEAWLVINKKHAPKPGVFYEEAVEEAVCYGWIDGLTKSLDSETYVIRFTPRRANSIWSMSNRERVARMIEQGRMTEAGMARVREAMANGQWEEAENRKKASDLPAELTQRLAEKPGIKEKFEALPASQKEMFLYWIKSARTAETRERRISEMIEMVEQNRRLGDLQPE